MREFEVRLPLNGLRKEHNLPRDEIGMVECYNVRVDKAGLAFYSPLLTYSYVTIPTNQWYYSQLFLGRKYNFYSDYDNIAEIDVVYNPIHVKTNNERMTFIDFQEYCIFLGDDAPLQYTVSSGIETVNSAIFPNGIYGCEFNGRVLLGNISNWYDCGPNHVAWSRIGNADFTVDKDNTAGYMPMNWNGRVLCVKKLGEHIIVYGDNGIGKLFMAEATLGFRSESVNRGIASPWSIDGDDHQHVYIDTEGYLWRRTIETNNKLGYKEWFEDAPGSYIVTYDNLRQQYYISNSDESYLLTEYGLSKIFQRVSGFGVIDGIPYGTLTDATNPDLYGIQLKTHTICLHQNSLKTLMSIELIHQYNNIPGFSGYVEWNNAKTRNREDFYSRPSRLLNPLGQLSQHVSGSDFRIGFHAPTYDDEDLNIEYIITRVKSTDKHVFRGLYTEK